MNKADKLISTVKEAFMATQEVKTLYAISNGLTRKAEDFDIALNDLADQLQSPIDDENRPRVDKLVDRLQDKMNAMEDLLKRTKTVISSLDIRGKGI